MEKSMRKRLIAVIVCFATIPLLFLGLAQSRHNYLSDREQVIEFQEHLTKLGSSEILTFIHELELITSTMLNTHFLPGLPHDQQQAILSKFLSAAKDDEHGFLFKKISLLDTKGNETIQVSRIALVTITDLADKSSTDEFKIPATEGSRYYGPIYFGTSTGEPLMKMSVPLNNLQTNRLEGVLVIEMKLKFMWKKVEDMRIGLSGKAFMTDEYGRIFNHPNPSVVLKKAYFEVPATPTIMQGTNGTNSVVVAKKIIFGGKTVFFVTEAPTSEAFRHINHSLLITGAIFLFTLSGAVIFSILIARQIVSPIESLAETAKEITKGNFTKKSEVKRNDELGELAMAFNAMTSRLVETLSAYEKEKNFVQNAIESLSHPFYVIDAKDYTIKLANSAAGLSKFHEKDTCYKLTHNFDSPCDRQEPPYPCPVSAIRNTKKPIVLEHIQQQEDGTSRTFEVYGYPIFDANGDVAQIIEYIIEITERRTLEEQLLQSQKLEAIGVLAGGVAHDFNNILTTILGYSELALMKLSKDDPQIEFIEAIHEAGERASGLTRQLLAFSRKQVIELQIIDLNSLIQNLVKMLGRLIGENIEMQLYLRSPDGKIKADPGQVEQILMNLTINARDAMPTGGNLILETDTIELDEQYCRVHAEVTPGSYIVLSVTDTGKGMTSEVQDQIFVPFFTTKKKGEGTGLGLSTVYGIIKQLKGFIFVYSEPDRGTTFKIYFPEEKSVTTERMAAKAPQAMQGGTETVLVVDDESSILRLIVDTLQPLGYHVLEAANGEDAVQIVINTDKKIDLLLTDVIMPGMSGKELAEKLGALRSDMKIMFMSGYTDNVIVHQGVLEPGVLFINKPVLPSLLTKKIRQVLDTR